MKNPEEVSEILKGLSGIGTHVSIDDFGTGYSSLSYLKRFSVQALKIDRIFVKDIAAAPEDFAIVGAIITMARGLNINVIAEGVETEEQLKLLGELRCDEYQGFLCSRPTTAELIEQKFLVAA
jgi:EAL domain-containing protein (putative c-di-GMP-specific phosphodiesterase class I)